MGKHSREKLVRDREGGIPTLEYEPSHFGRLDTTRGWDAALIEPRPTEPVYALDLARRTTVSDLVRAIRHSCGKGHA